MGKIVKFCSSCEESFAEKFSYCPNCASELSAFEMKPVGHEGETEFAPEPDKPAFLDAEEPTLEIPEAAPVEEIKAKEELVPEPIEVSEPEIVAEAESVAEESSFETERPVIASEPGDEWEEEDSAVEEEVEETEPVITVPVAAAAGSVSANKKAAEGTFLGLLEVEDKSHSADTGFRYNEDELARYNFESDIHDDNYKVTVVSEKSSKVRTGLLLVFSLVFAFGFAGLIINSLFGYLADVGSLVDEESLVALVDEVPFEEEEDTNEDEGDDEDGGGGGGGKEEEKPVSKGELVTQTRPPMMPPTSRMPQLTNPELPVVMSTEGDIKRDRILPPGMPNAISGDPSDGPGSGGGMGTGRGTGMGSGFGTGEGSGTGSGSGSGVGDGTGRGTGTGGRGNPPPARSGPTTSLKINSKPRPGYTDEARQKNVTGQVILKVTFMANGSIGSVSTVKGLPYGLTEKAIAAARRISFTPPMRNGQPYTVNKTIQYNFTIY
ncbi:MAG: TonB family protein [Acidobacteria bacterium]|nr:MAG: TonB family protein [Acidobacteriota bacterium]REK01631.1 MAG: TonB family protein [Acidobacteriota bacterium]REK14587.1 MAG: TonB family protein [Acidobacteriota bacterium]REK45302.1 MAG: TonB family protein [Acidobacteriota bacterium]